MTALRSSGVKLALPGQTLLLGGFYRPPDAKISPLLQLDENIAKINSSSSSPLIILGGDFNVPGVDWSSGNQSEPKGALQMALADLISNNHLTQKVTFTTRRDENGTENTLDLLLTTHPDLVSDVSSLPGISDHCIITAKFRTKVKVPTKPPRNIPFGGKLIIMTLRKLLQNLPKNLLISNRTKTQLKKTGLG